MKKFLLKNNKGLTFIETILYIGIFALMTTSLIPFALNIIGAGTKSTTQQEVYSNARFIAQKIAFTIRNASNINSITSSSASFATSETATNPTVIDLVNGFIRIRQGAGSAVLLNSNVTSVSALLFTNYSSTDGKAKHIEFQFTLTASPSSGRQEFIDATSIKSSAELRSN